MLPTYDNAAMRAIQITEKGGPEVMQVRDVPEPEAGDGELLVAVEAVGVNYRDVYEREGRGVIIAAFDGEEPPYFMSGAMGSREFVRVNRDQIDFMVCMDLVGHRCGPVVRVARTSRDEHGTTASSGMRGYEQPKTELSSRAA